MIVATVAGDVALILGALGIFIASLVGTWITYRSSTVIRDTHRQVVTLNESTIGELAAAGETRRAEDIPHDERTAMEQRHIDSAPVVGAAQGPQRMADRLAHVDERVEQVHHAVNGDVDRPVPSLYELVQGLVERLDRIETNIYGPPR